MICVSIGRTRHKMVVAEQRYLADKGAELVELRLDWLSGMPKLDQLIQDRPTPVIITLRRQSDRGRWRGTEEQRLTILRSAIVAGVEYVDLEADIAKQVRRYGETKRIISHHDFEETPDDLEEIYRQLCGLDPDIVKLVTMANAPSDIIRLLRLVKNATVPTIGFCMGEFGVASRILCGKYGSPFTYATFSEDRELAPGQLSFEQMKDIYHYDDINIKTDVYGVLGDPIAHSMSPQIHNAAFRNRSINSVYLPFRVAKHALKATLDDFEWLGIRGYSVTIPHKEEVISKAELKDASVNEIGAANTLYRGADESWCASNTDYDSAMQTIKLGVLGDPQATDDEIDDVSLAGMKILLLGAGGVARAISRGVVLQGAALTICSRTHKRAVALAEELGCQQVLWENRGSAFADILINCTPVGMHPNVDETPFEAHWLREGMLVFDTVYNPENTLLLKQAKERECRIASGLEMFVRQAALQFERFTGGPAPVETMRESVRRTISPVKY